MAAPTDRTSTLRRYVAPLWLLVLCVAGAVRAHDTPGDIEARDPQAEVATRYQGTIRALTIEDRVEARVFHFPRLELDSGGSVALLPGPLVDLLDAGDRVVVTARHEGKALVIDSIDERLAPRAAEKRLAQRASGRLEVLHADDFTHGVGRFSYRVRADDQSVVALAIDTLPPVLEGGVRVDVDGTVTTSGLAPEHIAIVAMSPERPAAKSLTPHTVLVVMANFSNTVAPGFTAAQAQQVMTSNATSVAKFYNEASFGQHQLAVTVTSAWITLSYAAPTCVDADLNGFTTAANTAARGAGYEPANYEFVVYLFAPLSCGWSGLAYIGTPKLAYINGPGSFATQVVGHEMGHNFGLLHAGSLRCTGTSIGGSCSVAEYGDVFDTMGNQHAGHFNAAQKRKLNWIDATTTPTHAGGTATYTLSPIETGGGATYGVKVPTPLGKRTYWLEYRQPIGFDNWGAWVGYGAQIRVATPFETMCSYCDAWSDDTELVDVTPGTSAYTDAALTVGSSFTDPNYPVTFNVLAATPTSLTVQVITPVSAGSSTTSLVSSQNPAPAGTTVTFTATVSGTAPTGTVAFKDGASAIAGCNATPLSGSGNNRTAACSTSSLATGSHAITAAYGGDAGNGASSSSVLTQSIVTPGWLGYLNGGNVASGSASAVAAGSSNVASGQGAFVGAGTANSADGVSSLVIGGFDNHASAIDSLVGAGAGNRATGARSVVVGGGYNLASGQWSFVGGGGRETGSGNAGAATQDNVATGKWSTVLGGNGNRAANASAQTGSVVAGGERNKAIDTDASVGGGMLNTASGNASTVVGGQSNTASAGDAAIGGGLSNTASATTASVPGGASNAALANYAFASGRRARATATGAFAFADSSNFDFTAVSNEFAVRASGGVRIVTGIDGTGVPVAGVAVPAGSGSWTSLSDRAAKKDLAAVDGDAVLSRVDALPIYTWRYVSELSGALHLGPTAQDFGAAFGLGDSDRRIAAVDASGVALASLRALHEKVARNEALLASRARRIAALRERVARLEASADEAPIAVLHKGETTWP